jgi:hypothetical protein
MEKVMVKTAVGATVSQDYWATQGLRGQEQEGLMEGQVM